ncbi:MAG: TlpA family protein disulfide reductase [Gemmataceae bacterium]|nr:TlpA family protein disulfide reductase [Gemmataceae bacterium]
MRRLLLGSLFLLAAVAGTSCSRDKNLGKPAPDIVGEDLDGNPLRLSDYRGKVVVLSFWGSWCPPCREMIPHERKLVERHRDKPFALLGVNSDGGLLAIRNFVARERITWRNWRDGGPEGPIARAWGITGWPTVYVLDAGGVIRYKDVRGDALDRAVDKLLAELK